MEIILKKSEYLDDWYLIERAKHEKYSTRISDACVEGTANEMLSIAEAIKKRKSVSFKRCAVYIKDDIAYFYSPRNSTREAKVPLTDADVFADQVFAVLTTPTNTLVKDRNEQSDTDTYR